MSEPFQIGIRISSHIVGMSEIFIIDPNNMSERTWLFSVHLICLLSLLGGRCWPCLNSFILI